MKTPAPRRSAPVGARPLSALAVRKELIVVVLLAAVGIVLLIGSTTMNVLGEDVIGPQFVPVVLGVLLLLAAALLAVDVIRHPEQPRDLEQDEFEGNFSADMLHDISGLAEPGTPGAPTAVTGAVSSKDVAAAVAASEIPTDTPSDADAVVDADAEVAAHATAAKNPSSDLRTLGLVLLSMVGFVVILPYAGWVISAAALFWCMCRLLGSKRPFFDIGVSLLASSLIQLAFGGLLGLSLPALFGGSL
ncbi:tripartite tricarboxylate transporter TctB family protein [Brachybacterium alimentarium]|uniref:tripartite tricarboxylate transporter TctB family protein n=2 Tax=Brachybacterium alimentarium TaxID=47845 RepID=UPI001596B428|nr:tripartite tricarboxylate transporter TctB family protein [Brachybacterium alimentarium]